MEDRYVIKSQDNRYVIARDAKAYILAVGQTMATKFTRERAEKFVEGHPGHELRKVKLRGKVKPRKAAGPPKSRAA